MKLSSCFWCHTFVCDIIVQDFFIVFNQVRLTPSRCGSFAVQMWLRERYLHYPPISLLFSPKTENQKGFQEEKRKKFKKKKRKKFLLPISIFLSQKGRKLEKEEGFFLLQFSLLNKKKEWKEGEKKQKKRKKRRKMKGDLFFLSPIPKRKEEEKEGNDPFFFPFRTTGKGKKKGRKYVSTRPWKQKDLVYQKGKQGLKLCNFILGKRQTFLPQRA